MNRDELAGAAELWRDAESRRDVRERVAEAERLAKENGADAPKDASTE